MSESSEIVTRYQKQFGDFIQLWNRTETLIRGLLLDLIGHSPSSYILAARLKSQDLQQTLQSIAADILDEELRAPVLHAMALYERLREYRNYYVHGIYAVVEKDGEAVGMVEALYSGRRLAHTVEDVSVHRIMETKNHLGGLLGILVKLKTRLNGEPQSASSIVAGQTVNWQLPPLPDKLQTPRRYPLAEQKR